MTTIDKILLPPSLNNSSAFLSLLNVLTRVITLIRKQTFKKHELSYGKNSVPAADACEQSHQPLGHKHEWMDVKMLLCKHTQKSI